MKNKNKSASEQMEELVEKFAIEINDFMSPLMDWLYEMIKNLINLVKSIHKIAFNDKKNKKNNKRLHRIKRNLMRRGT